MRHLEPFWLILISLMVSLTGCTKGGFEGRRSLSSGSPAFFDAPLVPVTDKLDPGCLSNANYDACLFFKSPIAQLGQPPSDTSSQGLRGIQHYGVKLTGLGSSGFLENSSFSVLTHGASRLPLSQVQTSRGAVDVVGMSGLSQVMVYYYLQRAIEFWSARGPVAVQGQGLKVVVDDQVAGWRPATKTIHLASRGTGIPMAFDASTALFYLSQANLSLAGAGAIDNMTGDTEHRACAADPRGCCRSTAGCSRALASGISLYFVGVLFPERPSVGDQGENSAGGARVCGVLPRNLNSLSSVTAAAAFSICSNRAGDVHALGSVYASALWQIRQSLSQTERLEFDQIFLIHLARLSGRDTLVSAGRILIDIAQNQFAGRFQNAIQSEFNRRGLSL